MSVAFYFHHYRVHKIQPVDPMQNYLTLLFPRPYGEMSAGELGLQNRSLWNFLNSWATVSFSRTLFNGSSDAYSSFSLFHNIKV